jgi:hypothetical protein
VCIGIVTRPSDKTGTLSRRSAPYTNECPLLAHRLEPLLPLVLSHRAQSTYATERTAPTLPLAVQAPRESRSGPDIGASFGASATGLATRETYRG